MRKVFTNLTMLGLVLTMASCQPEDTGNGPEDPSLSLDKTEVSIADPVDTIITVKLQSNVEWVVLVADNAATWITVDPDKGPASEELQTINIAVKANETIKGRSTRISFAAKAGGVAVDLDLAQSPKLSLLGRDSMALIDLYNSTLGWKWKGVWPTEDPINTWFGVTIGAVGGDLRVTKLDVSNRNLVGSLPESMQTLTELTFLSLAANGISGTLPEWLPKLTKLKEFYIARCSIGGKIPESYWEMTQLRQMDISSTGVSGPLSPKIGQMINLEEIDIEGCPIGGELPPEISKMSGLYSINAVGCGLGGKIPDSFGDLPKCTHFCLDGNPLVGGIPETITGPAIESIQISGCTGMKDPLPKGLSKCKSLWELRISYSGTSGSFPTEYETCPLEIFQAYDCKLSGELPKWEKHKTLTAFIASGNNFTGTLPEWVGNCAMINLASNNLTGSLPASLVAPNSTNTDLSLKGNSGLGGEIPSAFWVNPRHLTADLTGLNFSGTFPETESVEAQVLNWQAIKIEGNKFSGPIPGGLFTMNNIQTLWLANNNFTGPMPSDAALTPGLAGLSVSGNQLTGEFPASLKGHDNWSVHMWNPISKICPQQEGFGFTGDSCTKDLPVADI